nr:type I restriction-modification system subunit M N-terminal domain-containing protein [Jeotgalicoccus aerolatus]
MMTSDEIKRRLWDGANDLRGSMDASRYKDYMLGLMFYKFWVFGLSCRNSSNIFMILTILNRIIVWKIYSFICYKKTENYVCWEVKISLMNFNKRRSLVRLTTDQLLVARSVVGF